MAALEEEQEEEEVKEEDIKKDMKTRKWKLR